MNFSSYLKELNLKNINTKKVTDSENMFNNCPALEKVYVGNNWTLGEEATNYSGTFIKE